MKRKFLLSILAFGIIVSAFSEKATMELTFTAEDNGQYGPLWSSIFIENLTQGGDISLQPPDTILVIDYTTSIGDNETIDENTFSVSQNYPNPFKGKTKVNLYLQESDDIKITVRDILGRELAYYENTLNRGTHSFAFYPGNEKYYLLTVTGNQTSQTIKMLNTGSHTTNSEKCKIVYTGNKGNISGFKSQRLRRVAPALAEQAINDFAFNLGDSLQYTGYALTAGCYGSAVIQHKPQEDTIYVFDILEGLRCPGTPTVTDIDGNTYNTVQIGDQCWMNENLKTTTYQNGIPIPNVIDPDEWEDLTTGAYVWYDNDISWKYLYGALYNWYATVDANSLCPTGWHVPTHDEWTALTDFIGFNPPPGNRLKSCRQVNSPYGWGCNTTEHPRWNESDENGYDWYGFSGLPGGGRYNYGLFYNVGDYGIWWSSTESSSNNAWACALVYDYGGVNVSSGIGGTKPRGFSVRCLRHDEPTSEFIGEPTSGIAPLTVNFTDQSTNYPTSWQWDFGDGNSSTQQNPAHTYNTDGIYTVSLAVSNGYSSDTKIKTNYIYVGVSGLPCPGTPTVTYEGQVYNTVLIGSQCWLKENLNVGEMINGSENMSNDGTIEKYCYGNDPANCTTYGGLYQWDEMMQYTTTQGVQGICPPDWHLPTDEEWKQLEGTVDSQYGYPDPEWDSTGWRGLDAGERLKSENGWYGNGNGSDWYGFAGLPGGYRHTNGSFSNLTNYASFWSSSEAVPFTCHRDLHYSNDQVFRGLNDPAVGFSVRCVLD